MIVFALCHVVVRLTCAAIDIVESSCTPRSRMLAEVLTLHPQMSMSSRLKVGSAMPAILSRQ